MAKYISIPCVAIETQDSWKSLIIEPELKGAKLSKKFKITRKPLVTEVKVEPV